jgi:hypothetical protein
MKNFQSFFFQTISVPNEGFLIFFFFRLCLWWPYLLTDHDKMSSIYRGPSIDASYQVSVHLAEGVSEEKS